jgi:hypothetical protein
MFFMVRVHQIRREDGSHALPFLLCLCLNKHDSS